MTSVRKHGRVVQVSRELAIDHGIVEPTAAELADRVARRAEFAARARQAWVDYETAAAALMSLREPGVRAVLDLHGPNAQGYELTCSTCYIDTEMGDLEGWPCQTVSVLATAYGIPLPTWSLYLADRPT